MMIIREITVPNVEINHARKYIQVKQLVDWEGGDDEDD